MTHRHIVTPGSYIIDKAMLSVSRSAILRVRLNSGNDRG